MAENVVDLGVMPEPRANPLGEGLMAGAEGLATGIKEGAQTKLEAQKALLIQKNKYQVALAKIEHQQDEEDYKHTQTLIDQLGIMKDTDPAKFNLLMASPHGKELAKHVKNVIPDMIDDDGNVIVPGMKDQAKQSLEQTKVDYINAVKSGQPVDPHLEQAYKAIQEHGSDDIATALSNVSKSGRVDMNNQQAVSEAVKAQLVTLKQLRQQQSGATPQNPLAGGLVPSNSSNSDDPLGIFKK